MNAAVSGVIATTLRRYGVPEYQESSFTRVKSALDNMSFGKTALSLGDLQRPQGGMVRVVVRSLTKAYEIGSMYGKDRPEYRNKLVCYFQREADIMARAGDHPNIVGIMGFMATFNQDVFPAIVIRYFPLGDLRLCVSRKRIEMSDVLRLQLMLDVACGLQYLHNLQPAIVHRDLCASNILLDGPIPRVVARISDFGSAKLIDPTLNVVQQSTDDRSQYWYPPEWIKQKTLQDSFTNPKPSGDIWSFGCVFLEAWTGKDPWPKSYKSIESIAKGVSPPIPKDIEMKPGCLTLLKKCFRASPRSRPTAQKLVQELSSLIDKERLRPFVLVHDVS